jgi:hypothetical protein
MKPLERIRRPAVERRVDSKADVDGSGKVLAAS